MIRNNSVLVSKARRVLIENLSNFYHSRKVEIFIRIAYCNITRNIRSSDKEYDKNDYIDRRTYIAKILL